MPDEELQQNLTLCHDEDDLFSFVCHPVGLSTNWDKCGGQVDTSGGSRTRGRRLRVENQR